MTRVVVAPDSFGGWRTAPEVARAITLQLTKAGFHATARPLSDGGEGLLEALQHAGWLDDLTAVDGRGPLGAGRSGPIGWKDGVPVVESSTWLRVHGPPQPWQASSLGLGTVLAPLAGARVWLGLGGSSTVDMGLGLLHALGARLLDRHGRLLAPSPSAFGTLHRLVLSPEVASGWTVWSDVSTPVGVGARRFGPQKGVLPRQLDRLETGWARTVAVLQRWRSDHGLPGVPLELAGGGAAGGLGYTLACLGATVTPGASALAGVLLGDLSDVALLVTGEGRLDATTADDKVVAAVARSCMVAGTAFAAVVGSVGPRAPTLPGPVYPCITGKDRDQALARAVGQLITDHQWLANLGG